jgi:hypothetical protein
MNHARSGEILRIIQVAMIAHLYEVENMVRQNGLRGEQDARPLLDQLSIR